MNDSRDGDDATQRHRLDKRPRVGHPAERPHICGTHGLTKREREQEREQRHLERDGLIVGEPLTEFVHRDHPGAAR